LAERSRLRLHRRQDPEGQATGLHQNGVVSCLHLVTMNADRLGSLVGRLLLTLLQLVNDSLKVALELP